MSVEILNKALASINSLHALRAMKTALNTGCTHVGVVSSNRNIHAIFTSEPIALSIEDDVLRHDIQCRALTSAFYTSIPEELRLSGVYEISDLTIPEYEGMTFAAIADLPTLSVHTTPCAVVECIQDALNISELDSRGEMFKYSTEEVEKFSIEGIVMYSQGYSGKYGYELHRIKYEGVLVAYMVTDGKWTDEHELIPFGSQEGYDNMVSWIKENITPAIPVTTVYSDDSPLELPNTLLNMILNKTYVIEEK